MANSSVPDEDGFTYINLESTMGALRSDGMDVTGSWINGHFHPGIFLRPSMEAYKKDKKLVWEAHEREVVVMPHSHRFCCPCGEGI